MDKDEIRTNDLAKAIKAHLKCSDKEALEKAKESQRWTERI